MSLFDLISLNKKETTEEAVASKASVPIIGSFDKGTGNYEQMLAPFINYGTKPANKNNPLDIIDPETEIIRDFKTLQEGWDAGIADLSKKIAGGSKWNKPEYEGTKTPYIPYNPTILQLAHWAEDPNWEVNVMERYEAITGNTINLDTRTIGLDISALATSMMFAEGFLKGASRNDPINNPKSVFQFIEQNINKKQQQEILKVINQTEEVSLSEIPAFRFEIGEGIESSQLSVEQVLSLGFGPIKPEILSKEGVQMAIKSAIRRPSDLDMPEAKVKAGYDIKEGFKALFSGIKLLPKQIQSTAIKGLQGVEGASVVNKDKNDKVIQRAKESLDVFQSEMTDKFDYEKFLPGITIADLKELPQSLAFSITAAGVGLSSGGLIGLIPHPIAQGAAWVIGTVATGKVAQNMTSYEIMQQYLEIKNEEMNENSGRDITIKEENKLKEDFKKVAIKFGLWEAIPEAVGSALGFKLLITPLSKMVGKGIAGKILTKVVSVYGEELATETITEMGQAKTLFKAKFKDAEDVDWDNLDDWINAFETIAPQTFLLTTIMGGTISVASKINSLRKEIGVDNKFFKKLAKAIAEDKRAFIKPSEFVPGKKEINIPILEKKEAIEPEEGIITPKEIKVAEKPTEVKISKELEPLAVEEIKTVISKMKQDYPDLTADDLKDARRLKLYIESSGKAMESLESLANKKGIDISKEENYDLYDDFQKNFFKQLETVTVKRSIPSFKAKQTLFTKAQQEMPGIEKELLPIAQAIKGKTFDDAVKKIFEFSPDKRMPTNITDKLIENQWNRLWNVSKQGGYLDIESSIYGMFGTAKIGELSRVSEINNSLSNLEAGATVKSFNKQRFGTESPKIVTIYRGTPYPGASIRPGDYVTTDRFYAQKYTRGKFGSVVKSQLKAEDLLISNIGYTHFGEDVSELIYYPKGFKPITTKIKPKISFKEFYNQAIKAVKEVKPTEIKKEPYIKDIQADIIKKIHSKLNNKAYIKSITKKETRSVQTEIINALKRSGLDLNDKAKFISAIKNIQTIQQLQSKLPEILSRIETLTEKADKRTFISKIKKELKKFKIKKDKRGKTSVEYEMLKKAFNKKFFDGSKLRTQAQNEELLAEIQSNIENYDISNPSNYEDFVLYALLSEKGGTKGLNEMSVSELDINLTRILETRKIARDSFLFKQLDRAAKIHEMIKGSVDNMHGKGVKKQTASNKITIQKKLRQFISTIDIYDRGFLQIINLLDSIKGGKFYRDIIYQPIMEANKDYFVKNDDYLIKDEKMLKEVFNKKGILLDKQINKLNKQIHIGEMTDAQNNKFDLWFTNTEMLDIYLSSKSEENLKAMKEQGVYVGGKNIETRVFYMTNDVLTEIEKKMSKETKDIANYILENIKDKSFIKEMTTAYEAKYNKPFPFIKGNYWTMRRRYMGTKQKGSDIFNPEYNQQTILSPNSFNQRVKNDNPLSMSDGWTKYIKWRTDILKFVSYDESLTNTKSIIMSQDFKSEFIEIYGYKSYHHLLNSFDITANGGKNYSDVMAKSSNYIRKVLSVAFIGGKLRNILSQGTSFVAAMADIPVRDFNKSLGKFIANPNKAYNKMMTSPIIRLRHKRANFTKGLFEEETRKFKQYGLSPTKTAMFFTIGGDMMGVLGAGYAIYDYNYNKYLADNMDPNLADKKAMQDAENFVVSTQQSALPELKNAIMQAHPFIRTTGAFQQAQAMYRAKGYEALNTWLNSKNKWNKKNFRPMVKKTFIYHFTLPALYELSRGNINPLSITAKTIFSPISGFMGYGKVVEYGIMYAIVKMLIPLFGGDDDDWKDILPFDPNTLVGEAGVIFKRTVNSMNDWIEGEEDEKDIAQLIDSSLMLLRVPSKNIREEYYKFKDIFTGTDSSFLRLLQTKWQTEERKKEKKETFTPKKKKKSFMNKLLDLKTKTKIERKSPMSNLLKLKK